MPPGLLDSQFAALEEPGPDERPIIVSIAPAPEAIIAATLGRVAQQEPDGMSEASYPSLRERVVFVTGGGSGIGAEEVSQFAAQGARVAFVDIADAPSRALAARLAAAGHPEPFFQHCDLTDIAALRGAIAEVGRRLGPITVLVNNAANDQRHPWRRRDARSTGTSGWR